MFFEIYKRFKRLQNFNFIKRVSVPKPHTFMLFLSIVTAYIIKAYDKKPSSFAWVEHSVKMTLSYYISPDSVTDSLEFTISALILWLCIYLAYRMILRSLLNYKGKYHSLGLASILDIDRNFSIRMDV